MLQFYYRYPTEITVLEDLTMAQLTCDLCGGKLVMRPGGVAVCEGCSMEYSLESLKEKLGAPAAPAPTTPVADPIAHNLDQAKRWLEAKNYYKVEECCSAILDIDNTHQEAWYLTTLAHVLRAPTAASSILSGKKVYFTDQALWEKLIAEVRPAILSECDITYDSPKALEQLFDCDASVALEFVKAMMDQCAAQLQEKGDKVRALYVESARHRPDKYASASTYSMDAGYAFGRYTKQLRCDLVNIGGIVEFCEARNIHADEAFLKVSKVINTFMADALSFKYWSSSSISKSYYYSHKLAPILKKTDSDYKSLMASIQVAFAPILKREQLAEQARQAAAKAAEEKRLEEERLAEEKRKDEERVAEKRRQEERLAAIAQYWLDHPEQKKALDDQQAQHQAQLVQLRQTRQDLQDTSHHDELTRKIQAMQQEHDSLGIFKGKQKRLLAAELETTRQQLADWDKARSAQQRDTEAQIRNLNYQLEQIAKKLENPKI